MIDPFMMSKAYQKDVIGEEWGHVISSPDSTEALQPDLENGLFHPMELHFVRTE
jgi:hypothetical protein